MAKTEKSHYKAKEVAKLNRLAPTLDDDATAAKTPADADHLHALAAIIKQSGPSLH